jgi:hypothetical protein
MTMPEITDAALIIKLLRGTRAGKLNWEKTATPDQYAASYGGKWTVTVDKSEDQETGGYIFYLSIGNSQGEEALRIWNMPNNKVSELFEQARRHALKVDEALSALLKEIDEDTDEPQVTDDDIPF